MVTVPQLVRLEGLGPNGEPEIIEFDVRAGPGLVPAVVIAIGDTEVTVEVRHLIIAIEIVDYMASKPVDELVSRRITQQSAE